MTTIKGLAGLQKRLSQGLEDLKEFISLNHELLNAAENKDQVSAGDWQKTRRRLADFDKFAGELTAHENLTQRGSVELYWQARFNFLERKKLKQFLSAKETEYLGQAAFEIGRSIQNMIPEKKLTAMLENQMSDSEILREWSAVSEHNLKLLKDLAKVEADAKRLEKENNYLLVALENIDALLHLEQFEEGFFQGKVKHWPQLEAGLDVRHFTLQKVGQMMKDNEKKEAQLAELQYDGAVVVRLIEDIERSYHEPARKLETKTAYERCVQILQKYQGVQVQVIRLQNAAQLPVKSSPIQ